MRNVLMGTIVFLTMMTVWAVISTPAQAEEAVTKEYCKSILQEPQEFLKRSHYRYPGCKGKECGKRHQDVHEYRTRNYGRFKKVGKASWNDKTPKDYSQKTTFMGIKVTLNKRIIPAVKCVELELQTQCQECVKSSEYPNECKKKFPYKPKRLSGQRYRNSFKGSEVSNHVYGIALDLDPSKNTCCGCVAKWRAHPMCKKKLEVHERMIMPVCWVDIFEKYGFYWLGHDRLQDTMHFEFLGKPEVLEKR